MLLLLSRRLNRDKNELVILTMAWNFRCESEKLLDYAKHLELYTFMDSSVEMAHNSNKFHLKFLKMLVRCLMAHVVIFGVILTGFFYHGHAWYLNRIFIM